jgi:hypothetical protein
MGNGNLEAQFSRLRGDMADEGDNDVDDGSEVR